MPINRQAWELYPQVCDQVRAGQTVLAVGPGGVVSGPPAWPALDLPAVCAVARRLGYRPADWGLFVRQLKLIHRAVGEAWSDGQ